MITVQQVEQKLFDWAPRQLAESWDNVGHLVGDPGREVRRILVSLDITERVVQEAADGGFDLIVSHHPVMNCTWHPVQTLRADDRQGRILTKLTENRISAICMHTNLDAAEGGVNDVLAQKLGLEGLTPLTEEKIGRIGTLKCEMPLVEFTRFVIESLGCNGLRYTDCGKPVHRVAVGGRRLRRLYPSGHCRRLRYLCDLRPAVPRLSGYHRAASHRRGAFSHGGCDL